jgi:nitroreductase/NAD-dependent dihydropyrimidine dehydrogenase PreA subunit
MAIPTTRTDEAGRVSIDYSKCNGCGLCVEVCSDLEFKVIKGKVVPSGSSVFGCIACGQCMAVCPENAIRIEGRELSISDIYPLSNSVKTNFADFYSLLQRRRSIRQFKDLEVSPDIVEKILEAAQNAPMGVPPSDVNVLVINGRNKNHQFARDLSDLLENQQWFVSKWFISLMRLFWGKDTSNFFRSFIRPLMQTYIGSMKEGRNVITYDAPLAIYFYGTAYSDPADPVIAATYAMLAAESLGLGTCMIGGVHPFIQQGPAAEKFREKYGIRYKTRAGLMVIMGYPKIKFKKGIHRTFAHVDYLG